MNAGTIAPACGATRPATRDAGWTCDGTRLVMVMMDDGPMCFGAEKTPVVVREDLVWLADGPTRDLIRRYGTRPFAGGDHGHLIVRRS